MVSLQAETGEGGLTLEGVLSAGGMEEGLVERIALRGALEQLPEREREVLLLRYYKGLTQTNTARVLGVSQVQISGWSAGPWTGCARYCCRLSRDEGPLFAKKGGPLLAERGPRMDAGRGGLGRPGFGERRKPPAHTPGWGTSEGK